MLKLAMKSGAIFGVIGVVLTLITFTSGEENTLINYLGYGLMIGSIVLALYWYKKENKGLPFGEGVKLGVLTNICYSLVTGAFSAIYISIDRSFVDKVIDTAILEMEKESGGEVPEEAIEMVVSMMEMMMSPAGLLFMSILGGAFIGVVGGLIVSAIMKQDVPFEEELDTLDA